MVKLTALHYKIKVESLERYHKINELAQSQIFDWELEVDKARNLDGDYPEKPFIEPFEFIDSDYDKKELPFRIRKEDIYSYKENMDNIVEVTVAGDISYTVKEPIEFFDRLFEEDLDKK